MRFVLAAQSRLVVRLWTIAELRLPPMARGNSSRVLCDTLPYVRSLLVERDKEIRSDRGYRTDLSVRGSEKICLRLTVAMPINFVIRKFLHLNNL